MFGKNTGSDTYRFNGNSELCSNNSGLCVFHAWLVFASYAFLFGGMKMKKLFFFVLSLLIIVTVFPISMTTINAASTVMTAYDFVAKAKDIALNYKTLYVMGCFGSPLNSENKKRFTSNHSYNEQSERKTMINNASSDTFGFDCVCLIKGILWGWNGDLSHTNGGAKYATHGVPDISADAMINVCTEISTDFSEIDVGEAVWLQGHIGIYIGNGLAVECTPKWDNCVQITACNRSISGYHRRDWTKHGKLPYIEYPDEDNNPINLGDKFFANIYNPESQCQLTNSNNNVNLKSATNDANQLWYFERDSDLGYKITSFVDGTCLDAENGEYSNGTNVQTYDSNSSDSQRWYFIDIGMDHYSIRTKLGNAYIDAHTSGGIIEPGANTQLYNRQDTDAQVYCVNKVDDINAFLAHDIGTGFYANIINPTTGFLLTNTENNVTLNSKVSSRLTTAQIWKFERQPDNSYIIRSFMNNQCLDAENGKAEDGTNLQIYEDNATLAQKWIFIEPGNSNYMIKSATGNAVIDAKTSAGEISDGANIQLYHPNGTTAQAYSIQPINNINKYFADDIGTDFKGYIINPSTGYRLTNNNSNITLDSETEKQNQMWRFERQEDNGYIIRSAVDSTCIDAEMGETEDGTNVQTYEYNGTEAQRWYFYKKGNNQYTIVSSKADVVIDAKTSAGEISDGTNIQLYHPNGTDAQIYTIQIIDDEQKILGDADCDDEVTILDATVIQRHLVGIPVNTFDVTAADCDGDEDISIIDATWIQRYLVQMQVPYSIGHYINKCQNSSLFCKE